MGAARALFRGDLRFGLFTPTIADLLIDRGADVQLRSYLWAYPAGFDWFANLADAAPEIRQRILYAAYGDPLTPEDLAALWPNGPTIGGPGK